LALQLGTLEIARADVKLPALFTDHAVLQRDMPVPVWGTADPGEEIQVDIAGQTLTTKADEQGNWRVTLKPLSVGDPLTLVVKGNNELTVQDLLVGEVWLCSGQSNMEWPLSMAANGDLEITSANHPEVRLVRVKEPGSQEPVEDFKGQWKVCTPESVKDFSAVGYFFGRKLNEQLGGLCPVAAGPACPHCPQDTPIDVDGAAVPFWTATLGHLAPFSLTGHPSVVLPLARSSEGLPLGVQVVGRRWGEMELLAVAERIAEVSGPFAPPPLDLRIAQ
jgi:hypothetical protein